MNFRRGLSVCCTVACVAVALLAAGTAYAQPVEPLWSLVRAQEQPVLDSLRELTAIESGSGDREGLDRISQVIFDRLKALGAEVQFIEPDANIYRMQDTPAKVGRMVQAVLRGTGTRKILLIAHMDTVYLKGMGAKQPFRIDGNRAYGLAISDDKDGIAVILHTLGLLKALDFRDYGQITVLINGDEEISSPASRALLTKLGAEHDLTMSHESSPGSSDQLSLATAGIAAVTLTVTGKASHAGSSPEKGLNAIYEISHQLLQTKDFSDPARGLKLNWTLVSGGTNRNVIPAQARASADVRVEKVADYDGIEARLKDAFAKPTLIPGTKVEMNFERRRPPLELQPSQIAVGNLAQSVYKEIGKELKVVATVAGGGTDAAFAALATKSPVIERFGLLGYGAHSNDDEYILIDSIAPRLYLATRLIMEFSRGRP